MQTLKKRIFSRAFVLEAVLPCLLAVAAAFVARYQLELSDGVTADYLAGQWPLYAPLNAMTAFCLTLILYIFLGRWSRATLGSGIVFTILSIVNYYTRDLHGSALMHQDIFRNAMLPQITGLALAIGTLVGGALITELVFSYPGVGTLLFNAITQNDYPVIQAVTLIITVAVLVANFLVEIAYGIIDPRIRAASAGEK